jgi:hypothetical protein
MLAADCICWWEILMSRTSYVSGLTVGLGLLLLPFFGLQARPPIPSQIQSAKKVFISYAGQDVGSGDVRSPDSLMVSELYSDFYETIKDWGHFEVVQTPADADLVLEISVTFWLKEPYSSENVQIPIVTSPIGAQYRLGIVDPKTRILLWVLNRPIRSARNTVGARRVIVLDLKALCESTGESTNKR